MTIWIDAQLSPDLARWTTEQFRVEAQAVRDVHLRDARDLEIFEAARRAGAVVMTKDADFPDARLAEILREALPATLKLLEQGEALVEIADALRPE